MIFFLERSLLASELKKLFNIAVGRNNENLAV